MPGLLTTIDFRESSVILRRFSAQIKFKPSLKYDHILYPSFLILSPLLHFIVFFVSMYFISGVKSMIFSLGFPFVTSFALFLT